MIAQIKLYLMGAAVIVFLALIGVTLWYRGQAISAEADAAQAKADLATAIAVNRANEETIGRLMAQAAADAKGTAELAEQLRILNENYAAASKERQELKGSDDAVRDFLDLDIPLPLRRGMRPPT